MWSIDKYNNAMLFAGRWHKKQFMPGSDVPYLLHLAQVSQCALRGALTDPKVDIDLVMQAAILHDVLEDTNCTYQELVSKFGSHVAEGVSSLSKRTEIEGRRLSKSEQMDDSLVRILAQPKEIAMVKLADRSCNLRQPPHHWFHRDRKIEGYRAEAQKICDALGDSNLFLKNLLQQRIQNYQPYIQKRQHILIRDHKSYPDHIWQNVRMVGCYRQGRIVFEDGAIALLARQQASLEGKTVFAFGTLCPNGFYPLFMVQKVGDLPLEAAYRATSYCAERFTLHIDQKNPKFDAFLEKNHAKSWCFVTAFNPMSQNRTRHENRQNNLEMEAQITSMGYPLFRGVGMPHTDNWEPEESFLVLKISEQNAIQLGTQYKQKAIVFGQRGAAPQLKML